jgi:hypothetical protein
MKLVGFHGWLALLRAYACSELGSSPSWCSDSRRAVKVRPPSPMWTTGRRHVVGGHKSGHIPRVLAAPAVGDLERAPTGEHGADLSHQAPQVDRPTRKRIVRAHSRGELALQPLANARQCTRDWVNGDLPAPRGTAGCTSLHISVSPISSVSPVRWSQHDSLEIRCCRWPEERRSEKVWIAAHEGEVSPNSRLSRVKRSLCPFILDRVCAESLSFFCRNCYLLDVHTL